MEEQLAKYFAGEASQEEKNAILAWRGEQEANAELYLEFKETWILTSSSVHSIPELELNDDREAKVIGWPSYLKYAAAVVLLAMISAIWIFNQSEEEISSVVFAGTSQVLEDGTIISLKDDATISKIEFSDAERKVFISGKAFFEVEHDANRPFYVITEEATVRVLGTSFLVNNEADFTEVCVESGLVSFSTNDNLSLNLERGEMGLIGKDIKGVIKRDNDNQNFLGWKNGILTYQRAKTSDVIASLEDTYNIDIIAPAEILDCRLTAQFNKNSLEDVIQILSTTFGWTYEINNDKVVLSGEGC